MTRRDVEALAVGGAILGGGGGGWAETGRQEGLLALEIGDVELWGADEAPEDWTVVTCAALGAPSQRGATKPRHFIRAVQLLREVGVEFDGLMAAENGGHNSFGGWIPAAALGLPVVDTPGDGRAHPTAMMGSMGLHRIEYSSVKAGCTEGSEVVAWGSLQSTSNVIRAQARDMKALVAMARDPVKVAYTKEHGAPGGIGQAMELGEAFLGVKADDPKSRADSVVEFLDGEFVCQGRIAEKSLAAEGGFDVGNFKIKAGDESFDLSFVNEYMTLEAGDRRLATFPDLVITFDEEGLPATSAQLEEGDTVYLISVDKSKILVGDGNRYIENIEPIERVLKRPLIEHIRGYMKN
jgi:DUF917 family protein